MPKAIEKITEVAKDLDAKEGVLDMASKMINTVKGMMEKEVDKLSPQQEKDLRIAGEKIEAQKATYAKEIASLGVSRAGFLDMLKAEIGEKQIESSYELLIVLDYALTVSIAKRVAESVGSVIQNGQANDEKFQREYESDNVRNTIKNFVSVKVAEQMKEVGAALETDRGKAEFINWKDQTRAFLWEKIKEVSAWGIAFITIGARKLDMSHAGIICDRMREYFNTQSLKSFGSMPDVLAEVKRSVPQTETLETKLQAAKKESRKLLWATFAGKLEKEGGAWSSLVLKESEKRSPNDDLKNEVVVSDIQKELIDGLDLTNPLLCVVGNQVFLYDENGKWMTTDLSTLKNAQDKEPKTIFRSLTDSAEYVSALKALPEFQGENGEVVARLLDNLNNDGNLQKSLSEMVGEKLTIQKNFGPYDRKQLEAMGNGREIPSDIRSSLNGLISKEFHDHIKKLRLNFIKPDVIQKTIEVKQNAILSMLKEMKVNETISTIDQEGKKDAELAGEDFNQHEKFVFEIFQGGNVIRIIPEKPHEWEKQRFAGATRDAIESKIREEMENPFASIPILGPMIAGLTKIPVFGEKIKEWLNNFAKSPSIQKTFGIKPPKEAKDIDTEVKKRTGEEMKKVIEGLTTRYPLREVNFTGTPPGEFTVEANKDPDATKKSIMLQNQLEHFTGTITIPNDACVRFSDHVFVTIPSNSEKQPEKRENIFAGNGPLVIKLKDQKIAQYSIFPVGTKFERKAGQ